MLDVNNYLGKMLAERYRLVRLIGKSASSLVFYAEDMMNRGEDGAAMPVAVKVLDRDSSEYKVNEERFRAEIQAVARIPTNPHVVAVTDASFSEDEHFVVMEYVSGKTLSQYMKERGGKLSPKVILSISLQILQALRLAHEVGVIHRDIKPQNIMIERADAVGQQVEIPGGAGMPFVKLADFGVALLPDTDLFAVGEQDASSVRYISPEQVSGGVVGVRSDIYSLGVVMYEMATGQVPFDAQSAAGIIAKHQTEMPHHVSEAIPDIPTLLDEVIFIAMQKNPAMRYKDAFTMERRLREIFRYLVPGAVSQNTAQSSPFLGSTIKVGGAGSLLSKAMRPQKEQKFEEDKPPKPPKLPKPERAPKAPKAPKPAKLPKTVALKASKPPKAPKEKKQINLPSAALMKKIGLIGGGAVLLAALIVCGILFVPRLFASKTLDITVPNLVGSIYAEGSTYAEGVTVPADKIVYEYNNDHEAGKIIAQQPSGGVLLEDVEGVEVIITVSKGPEMMDFSIPAEYCIDADTAKAYLRDNGYTYVTVYDVRPASAPVAGAASGSVVGVLRRGADGMEEELSLDQGKIYKNKAEKLVLLIQP